MLAEYCSGLTKQIHKPTQLHHPLLWEYNVIRMYETYVKSFRIGLEFTLRTKDDFNTPVPEAADTDEGSL